MIKQMQYLPEFQSHLPKLISITLIKINGAALLKILCNAREFSSLIQDNEEISTVHSFINNHTELKVSDPLIVILNDSIEKKFDDEKPDKESEDVIE